MAIRVTDFKDIVSALFKSVHLRTKEYNTKLAKIAENDDWSFLIKAVAILDSSATRLLVARLGDSRFERLIHRMSFSAKVDLLFDLDLCDKQMKRMMNQLASMRNRLAHDPNEMNFTFKSYIRAMSGAQRKRFVLSIQVRAEGNGNPQLEKLTLTRTKVAIWVNLVSLLSVLALEEEDIIGRRKLERSDVETNERLLKSIAPHLFPDPS